MPCHPVITLFGVLKSHVGGKKCITNEETKWICQKIDHYEKCKYHTAKGKM